MDIAAKATSSAAILSMVRSDLISTDVPLSETTSGAAGNSAKVPTDKHQHPRLTVARYSDATAADGTVLFMFSTRSFASKPNFIYAVDNMDGVTATVYQWITDGNGNYTGARIRATRRVTNVSLVTALVALINVLTGVTANTTDVPVQNATISCVFLQQTS